MPNAHEWGSGPKKATRGPMYYARGWRVPIDDQHYYRFGVSLIFVGGASKEAYLNGRIADARRKRHQTVDIGNAVLRGELSPHELTPESYPDLVNIQDYVAQIG